MKLIEIYNNLPYKIKILVRFFYKLFFFKFKDKPGFVSNTIDFEDVLLALKYLIRTTNWNNKKIIKKFENNFKKWNGSKYAYSFMSGRVALSAIIKCLNLKSDDEIIIPGYTCVVVNNSFLFEDLKMKYCDIELDTFGLDYNDLIKKVTDKTKVILIHHLYGLVSRDYEKIVKLSKEKNIFLIEDCAHSTGAEYKNRKIGNLGDASFFSFEHSKVLTTFNGGMAITNNKKLAIKLKDIQNKMSFPDKRRHKKILLNIIFDYFKFKFKFNSLTKELINFFFKKNIIVSTLDCEMKGIKPEFYGEKMPASLSEIGILQLKKIDKYNNIRRTNSCKWNEWCDKNGFNKPVIINNSKPVFLRYPVLVNEKMKKNHKWADNLNVNIGVWFKTFIHPSEIFPVDNCPNASIAVKTCINFPTL